MKKKTSNPVTFGITLMIALFMVNGLHAQEFLATNSHRAYYASEVDELPAFPGGKRQLTKYLSETLEYPATAKAYGIEGDVKVELTIGESGKIKSARIRKSLGYGCDEEVLKVVRSMPNWLPGEKGHAKVATKIVLSVGFSLAY